MTSWRRLCTLAAALILAAACAGTESGTSAGQPTSQTSQSATPTPPANPIDPCKLLSPAQANSAAGGEWQQQPGSATPDPVNYAGRTCMYVSGNRTIGVTVYPQPQTYDKLVSSFSSQQAYIESVAIQNAKKAAYYGPASSRLTGILLETGYGTVQMYAKDTPSQLGKTVWAQLAANVAAAQP